MPGRVVDDERVDATRLAGFELRDEVRDRLVLRVEVEQDADVAELERAVHEARPLAELGGRGDREVDRERRAADAALRAEDGDDAAGLAGSRSARRPRRRWRRRRATGGAAHAGQLLPLAGVDLSDRRGQLVAS